MRRIWFLLVITAPLLAGLMRPTPGAQAGSSPIQHVVVIMLENRSFDNLFGPMCAERVAANDPAPCDGATQGKISNGTTRNLALAPDVQPSLNHSVASHLLGLHYVNGVAQMDGFDRILGCKASTYYCYDAFDPNGADAPDIANVFRLANTYTISDRTFESSPSSSWVSHLEMAAGTRDLFHGDNPHYVSGANTPPHKSGWGCQSNDDATYDSPTQGLILVPSCVPDSRGAGPYRASPVQYVPTLFDRLDSAGLSWHVYIHSLTSAKSPCSYFWECYSSPQAAKTVSDAQFVTDAKAGNLPAVSILVPQDTQSMHPTFSVTQANNWLGTQVSAVGSGPDWSSTAVFITWDDAGVFYDHVPPPVRGEGIRVPMLVVSPYAKPHFVDHQNATLASLLDYTETTFGLSPLGQEDRGNYDFSNAFDYTQSPLPPPSLSSSAIPNSTTRYLARHPGQHQAS